LLGAQHRDQDVAAPVTLDIGPQMHPTVLGVMERV
jgi:hypothetical protein